MKTALLLLCCLLLTNSFDYLVYILMFEPLVTFFRIISVPSFKHL